MPEFVLDTQGTIPAPTPNGVWAFKWSDLDAFTQGYIEAAFFTSTEELQEQADKGVWKPGWVWGGPAFSDLDPEALAAIIEDCREFQATAAYTAIRAAEDNEELGDLFENHGGVSSRAGHDFWMTRCGHGCGFWDGDWPEPHATALTDACKAFGEVSLVLGDDGKVYCE